MEVVPGQAAVPGQTAAVLFADAVRATCARWTALNLAISYSFGDGNEAQKREDMVQQIVGGFAAKSRAPDPTELEAFLETYLQDNFNLFADDESPYEVSILVCRLHALISAGQIADAQQLLATPVASLDACVDRSTPAVIVGQPDAEGEDDGRGNNDSDDAMMDAEEAAPREEEKIELSEEQQADLDDGWGVVVKSNKGRVKQVLPGQGGAGP